MSVSDKRGGAQEEFFDPIQQPEVNRVGIRVPPFYPQKPALWFAQLESQFILANITSESTKFHHTMSNLDPSYAAEVEDIIVDPNPDNKYTRLKSELIKRLSASKEKKVIQLITREELGDRTPSQFLRHLKNLAGPDVPDDFLRTLWTSRLPNNVQSIIASQAKASLEEVAELADRVLDVVSPASCLQVASTSSTTARDTNAQIAALTRQVRSLQAQLSRKTRSRSRNSNTSERRRSASNYKKYNNCWYHNKFGNKAKKCIQPCDYTGNAAGSR